MIPGSNAATSLPPVPAGTAGEGHSTTAMDVASAPPGRRHGWNAPGSDLTSILARLAEERGGVTAVTVSRAGADTAYGYAELWRRASAAGRAISSLTTPGDRVLLPMQTGAEFIDAFFGCLLAGRIAVPLPVERKGSRFSRLANVVADCSPSLAVLRTGRDLQQMQDGLGDVPRLLLKEEGWPEAGDDDLPSATPRRPAFIQYTSGSTSSPKGVLITHGNIVANVATIRKGMGLCDSDRVVSWLPVHHDLGLMGILLAPVIAGARPYLYPPEEFAKDPAGRLARVPVVGRRRLWTALVEDPLGKNLRHRARRLRPASQAGFGGLRSQPARRRAG